MNPLQRSALDLAHRAVQIGHRCVERAGEVTPDTRTGRRFGALGPGSLIGYPQASLVNIERMHFGRDVLVGRHATLAIGYGPGDPYAPDRALVVGDRAVLGARITITAHESIVIGDDVFFGQNVFVTDASHGYQDPELPIGRQFGPHAPVSIGAGSWIGHGAMILPGAQIGRNVVVAAGSVVRGSVPDRAIVAGTPARIVRSFEPGVGWADRHGDVRPIVPGVFSGVQALATPETSDVVEDSLPLT
ncbi:acyltransferase [Nocardioides sp. R-C-SC26]|uniref:acyltransferase n=1 Tax=Nocardioides sp. R-C-SC26 TaxID=2870414 RepID=UPI0027E1EFD3|nr:acyltransferase [Nocardioides sp. R-C-SC26]